MTDPTPTHNDGLIGGGAPAKREYTPPAIVYEGTLEMRAGSRPCVGPEHGCYDVEPEQLFGGG